MKLIAEKWISDQLPAGTAFEIPDDDVASAETLILAGYARKDLEPASSEVAPSRRTYRRRDLQAEP